MKNYLFEIVGEYSDICGEQFFVQCNSREEADEILAEYFWGEKVELLGVYTDEEAEWLGLDTY